MAEPNVVEFPSDSIRRLACALARFTVSLFKWDRVGITQQIMMIQSRVYIGNNQNMAPRCIKPVKIIYSTKIAIIETLENIIVVGSANYSSMKIIIISAPENRRRFGTRGRDCIQSRCTAQNDA